MRADPDRWALGGGLVFVGFALVASVYAFGRDGCAAYASEVPPLIAPITRPTPPAPAPLPAPSPAPHADTYVPRAFSIDEGDELASEAERVAVERAIASCSRGRTRATDPFAVLELLRLEEALGAPPGLLVATWCIESALRTEAPRGGPIRGDWRDGAARALGPLQLHGWAWTLCGLTDAGRDDIEASAACYWSRVEARLGECDGSIAAAEALVASGAAGCRPGGSAHWRELQRWGQP